MKTKIPEGFQSYTARRRHPTTPSIRINPKTCVISFSPELQKILQIDREEGYGNSYIELYFNETNQTIGIIATSAKTLLGLKLARPKAARFITATGFLKQFNLSFDAIYDIPVEIDSKGFATADVRKKQYVAPIGESNDTEDDIDDTQEQSA